jgi:hypothetical protein
MDTIKRRYNQQQNVDWTKTRNYLYRTSDRLTLQQIDDVLSCLDQVFSNDLVCSVLATSPRILRKNVTTHLMPTMQFLQQLYGPEMFREAISRNPDLLLSSGVGYGGPNNDEMDTFLRNQIELSSNKINKLKKTAPFLFRLSQQKVRHVLDFMRSILENGGLDETEQQRVLAKVLMNHPYLMNLSVEANFQPRMNFLMERCQLSKSDAAALIKTSPGILGLSVEDNLRPTLDFLSTLLENDTCLLRKCLTGHAQLLALSLKNLQQKVDYFDAIDGQESSGPSLASRIAIRSPAVYSLSLRNNIIPTVEFLAKAWGTTPPKVCWHGDAITVTTAQALSSSPPIQTKDSLSSLLQEFPTVLTLSLEGNIQPTLTFFNRTGYTSLHSDWRLKSSPIIRGRYIAASLFNRLLPRWHHLIANGLGEMPPLHLLVGATDRAFCEQMGFDVEDYAMFKDQSIPRLKFSSQFDTWLKTGRPIDVQ